MNKKKIITIILLIVVFVALTLIGVGIYSNIVYGSKTGQTTDEKEYKLDQKHTKKGISIDNLKIEETEATDIENIGDSKAYKVTFTLKNETNKRVDFGQAVLRFLYDDSDQKIERTFDFRFLEAGASLDFEKVIVLNKTNFYDYEMEVVISKDVTDTAY